ncbi:hypothetical protein [Novosphingobium beihaiensis]|uniref:Mor transcription activator family protein n=1 Tax=Novosphingobium beihaiensis TaxID=2930389 RepID=A0ABT0BJK9_9SPHN|nr:hypothetical protein [Novosphingobium beihaiensis]MCJ2185226.1 hypothetical protein [Novosphingobium beihaiensis]
MNDEGDFSLSSDEMLVSAEDFSLMRVEVGLRNADLCPLAEHLRNGFSLPPEVSGAIADAIEGRSGAPCSISAVHQRDGRPSEGLHSRNIEIGLAYEKELKAAKRGEAKRIRSNLAKRFHVSEATVRDAVAYTRRWLSGLVGTVSAGK